VELLLPGETHGGGSGASKGLKGKKDGKGIAGKVKMEDEEVERLLDADEDREMMFSEDDTFGYDNELGHRCQPSYI